MSAFINSLNIQDIKKYLGQTALLGREIFFHEKIDSTNDEALRLIAKDPKKKLNGVIIVSTEQTKGRGTKGALWYSPSSMGLYTSIILYPEKSFEPSQLPSLPKPLGEKIVNVLKTMVQGTKKIVLKEPNDILIEGKKVIGILCESSSIGERVSHIVIGIGVNLFKPSASNIPCEIEGKIGFLADYMKIDSVERVYSKIIREIDELISFWHLSDKN